MRPSLPLPSTRAGLRTRLCVHSMATTNFNCLLVLSSCVRGRVAAAGWGKEGDRCAGLEHFFTLHPYPYRLPLPFVAITQTLTFTLTFYFYPLPLPLGAQSNWGYYCRSTPRFGRESRVHVGECGTMGTTEGQNWQTQRCVQGTAQVTYYEKLRLWKKRNVMFQWVAWRVTSW